MSDEPPVETNEEGPFKRAIVSDLKMKWRDVPTVFVDHVIGFAVSDNVVRLTMGEMAFAPNADMPNLRPVLNLAMSLEALHRLTIALNGMNTQLGLEVEGEQPQAI